MHGEPSAGRPQHPSHRWPDAGASRRRARRDRETTERPGERRDAGACKVVCDWGWDIALGVGVDALLARDGELGGCSLAVGRGGVLDRHVFHRSARGSRSAVPPFLFSLPGSITYHVPCGEPQELHGASVVGEVPAVGIDSPEPVAEELDGVGSVGDLPGFGGERQERSEAFPALFERNGRGGVGANSLPSDAPAPPGRCRHSPRGRSAMGRQPRVSGPGTRRSASRL